MADVQAYYEFGTHRTALEGDLRTSAWLAHRFRGLGLETRELHEAHLAPEPARTGAWVHLGAQVATPP